MPQLLGTTQNGCRVIMRGSSSRMRKLAAQNNLAHWAIYRDCTINGPFHNATDESYLLSYHNDPYWINRAKCKQKHLSRTGERYAKRITTHAEIC